jgi:hypothetical protein
VVPSPLLRMDINTVFRDIYVNLAARVLLFAKSLIQRLYGENISSMLITVENIIREVKNIQDYC